MRSGRVINSSPWLYGLKRSRNINELLEDATGDIGIIGGGIAGIASAYFLLTRTDRSVVLLEKGRVADGATGNNAGIATPIFERSLDDFMGIFGPERVRGALQAVNDSWELLREIHAFGEGMDPAPAINAFIGYRTKDEVAPVLAENALRVTLGSTPREVFYAEEKRAGLDGPLATMPGLTFIPQQDIAKHLRTSDARFIAAVSDQEVLLSSASLSEKVVVKLLATYPDRFRVYENSEVRRIILNTDTAEVKAKQGSLTVKRVVLATNGFERFSIEGKMGEEIHIRYHKNVTSRLAYMLGVFLPGRETNASSVAHVHQPDAHDPGISYEYITERAYELDGAAGTLISIGGPDSEFNHERADYSAGAPFSRGVESEMERYLEVHFGISLKDVTRFKWHGLMGYTETYARLVGADTDAPALLYNVGCNGVGILLSVWGGARLSDVVLGKPFHQTMFDPEAHLGARTVLVR